MEFGYFNYVDGDVQVIADAEQMKRVIHNIVNNSLKYMDKQRKRSICGSRMWGTLFRWRSRTTAKGSRPRICPIFLTGFIGPMLPEIHRKAEAASGLSIVKKIIEEHGGKIWATSREETGTTMYFVLRKYQEVPIYE